jgi:hypothetical protein
MTLDAEVIAGVEALQRQRPMSMSDAVNALAKSGLVVQSRPRRQFVQTTADLGSGLDVTRVPEALELLDGVWHT